MAALDYRTAFDLAPVGLVLSRNRLMLDCNRQVLEMFAAAREAMVGQSFELLYPTRRIRAHRPAHRRQPERERPLCRRARDAPSRRPHW